MNTQELIQRLLNENKSFFTKNKAFLGDDIPAEKFEIIKKSHQLAESENILWAVDRTLSGKATDSCIITNFGIRFIQTILGQVTVKSILWFDIAEFFYNKKKGFVFISKKGDEIVFDRMDFDVFYKKDSEQIDTIVKVIGKIIEVVSLKPPELPMSENEEKFMDDVKFMFEDDGQIIDAEKRILDNLSNKYGIEKKRAEEIISVAFQSFQLSDMNEYMNEVKTILDKNGQIGEAERRALDFFREKLGISVEKAKKIELLTIKNTN
ncbi:MAG: hypothetical protein JXL97_16965 [Bacteroidales bacterium]|nr:hypothetical protein [Bacteroidales bacterium]